MKMKVLFLILAGLTSFLFFLPEWTKRIEIRNIATQRQNMKTKDSLDILSQFVPSGWMGDGEFGDRYINFNDAWKESPHSSPFCVKIAYKPSVRGWAGIFWQNEPDNWGDIAGKNLSKSGFKKITFWTKGETGKEIVEFKAGGITGQKYKDSFTATTGKVVLKKVWTKYTLDLTNKNLSSVVGGFCWVASRIGNPNGLTFYLDDVQFE